MRNVLSQATDREHPDVRRRRLLFRCWHRGTQESDFILGGFADVHLADFDSAQLDRFEHVIVANTNAFGTGTLTLFGNNGNNTYTGQTFINNGVLTLAVSGCGSPARQEDCHQGGEEGVVHRLHDQADTGPFPDAGQDGVPAADFVSLFP